MSAQNGQYFERSLESLKVANDFNMLASKNVSKVQSLYGQNLPSPWFWEESKFD